MLRCCPWFWVSTGAAGAYPPWIQGDNCIHKIHLTLATDRKTQLAFADTDYE